MLRALKRLYVAITQDQFAFKQNAQVESRFQCHFEDLDFQNNSMFEDEQSRSKNRERSGSYKSLPPVAAGLLALAKADVVVYFD